MILIIQVGRRTAQAPRHQAHHLAACLRRRLDLTVCVLHPSAPTLPRRSLFSFFSFFSSSAALLFLLLSSFSFLPLFANLSFSCCLFPSIFSQIYCRALLATARLQYGTSECPHRRVSSTFLLSRTSTFPADLLPSSSFSIQDGLTPPVNHIRFAHDTYAKTRRLKDISRSATRSVTSLVYLTHGENLLASAGSADGCIRLWDLRKNAARRINPSSVEDSTDFCLPSAVTATVGGGGNAAADKGRSYGVSSLALSPDGSRLYALSVGSR